MTSESNKENEIPLEMVLQRSFESIWYQSEVLHKRTSDLVKEKFESQDKRLDALEKWNDTLNETIRDRIMMFSQDIIATLKDMLAKLQEAQPTRQVKGHNVDSFDDPGYLDEQDPQQADHDHGHVHCHSCSLMAQLEEEDPDLQLAP